MPDLHANPPRPRLRNPFTALLAALALLFLAGPLVREENRLLSNLLVSLVLLGGIAAAADERRYRALGLGLGITALLLRWGAFTADLLIAPMLVANVAFLAFTMWLVLVAVARQREVTVDTISGGLSVYLLIGTIWALAFNLLETQSPGSFRGMGEGALPFDDFFYLSFVTITTLGYGDIVPVGRLARTLATAEALVGQIFLAVFIARLVGLYTARESTRSSDA